MPEHIVQKQNLFIQEQFNEIDFFDSPIIKFKKRIPLHIMITSCGKSSIKEDNYFFDGMKRGKQPFATFQFTTRGEGCLIYEKKEYRLKEGSAMLVLIPHDHCYFYPEDQIEPWEFFYVSLAGSEIYRIIRHIHKILGPVFSLNSEACLYRNFIEIARTVQNLENHSEFEISSLAYEFIMDLMNRVSELATVNNSNDPVIQVKRYCHENYMSPISIDDMTRISGYSRHHFIRIFTKSEGVSPYQYLTKLRMDEAIRQLHNPGISIKEAAHYSGFNDVNYFCRVFKKKWGITPGDYSKQWISQWGRLT